MDNFGQVIDCDFNQSSARWAAGSLLACHVPEKVINSPAAYDMFSQSDTTLDDCAIERAFQNINWHKGFVHRNIATQSAQFMNWPKSATSPKLPHIDQTTSTSSVVGDTLKFVCTKEA